MNRIPVISTECATPEIDPDGRLFEVFQGAAGLTAIREDWKRVTRALGEPRFFHHLNVSGRRAASRC
jgi:hypothetical protein